MVTRHEFLAQLHATLRPRGYLEVGVQHGTSLALAKCLAVGIDPAPMLQGHFPGTTQVYQTTSDDFFFTSHRPLEHSFRVLATLDLAFIDGMHLFEYALRDFENIEQHANSRTVVVFDDVLPRNQHEAARDQCPGDWTGDVWKVPRLLESFRNLKIHVVNTTPTGTAVVYGFPDKDPQPIWSQIKHLGLEGWEEVPDDVINRVEAVDPDWALQQIATHLLTVETQELEQ